jgi:hypothetical protein
MSEIVHCRSFIELLAATLHHGFAITRDQAISLLTVRVNDLANVIRFGYYGSPEPVLKWLLLLRKSLPSLCALVAKEEREVAKQSTPFVQMGDTSSGSTSPLVRAFTLLGFGVGSSHFSICYHSTLIINHFTDTMSLFPFQHDRPLVGNMQEDDGPQHSPVPGGGVPGLNALPKDVVGPPGLPLVRACFSHWLCDLGHIEQLVLAFRLFGAEDLRRELFKSLFLYCDDQFLAWMLPRQVRQVCIQPQYFVDFAFELATHFAQFAEEATLQQQQQHGAGGGVTSRSLSSNAKQQADRSASSRRKATIFQLLHLGSAYTAASQTTQVRILAATLFLRTWLVFPNITYDWAECCCYSNEAIAKQGSSSGALPRPTNEHASDSDTWGGPTSLSNNIVPSLRLNAAAASSTRNLLGEVMTSRTGDSTAADFAHLAPAGRPAAPSVARSLLAPLSVCLHENTSAVLQVHVMGEVRTFASVCVCVCED